jgi:methionine synthase II (cobalamin-independent)
MNILDDSLITDCIENNGMTEAVKKRLFSYYKTAYSSGAELILNTCSSVGEAVDEFQLFPIPIVRIDEPMCREALKIARNIAVVATIQTTLSPTVRLLEKCAREVRKNISVTSLLAKGAFEAITAGDTVTHDQILADTVKTAADTCELFLLAQASMERMEVYLHELTGRPVLSSPRLGIQKVRHILEVL